MTQIIVTKPGVLSARDKSALRKAGLVPVEADNPSDVRLMEAEGSSLSGDDMLFAAMKALASGEYYTSSAKARLPGIMLKLIEQRRQEQSK